MALFHIFTLIDNFEWFWMGSLHTNIQLMLEFVKAPFLDLHLSFYTLIHFLMLLSVILLSMLMILLSALKFDQASDLCQQLEMESALESDLRDTVDWALSDLLISVFEKFNLVHFTSLIFLVLLMWKWMGLFLKKNLLLRCWDYLSLLNWIGVLAFFLLLKLPPWKSGSWFGLWQFFLVKLVFVSIIYHTALHGILLSCVGCCF